MKEIDVPFRVTQAEVRDGLAKVVVHMPDFSVRFGAAGGETELDAYRNAFVGALRRDHPEVDEVKVSPNGNEQNGARATVVFQRGDQQWESHGVSESEANTSKDFRVTALGRAVAQGFMQAVNKK